MQGYSKEFKEEAVKLSYENGVKVASEQLGIPYHTLSGWRRKVKKHKEAAFIGSGHTYPDNNGKSAREMELEKKVKELEQANEILKDALGFFAQDRRK